jgi:SAM-dependent methyltransferase
MRDEPSVHDAFDERAAAYTRERIELFNEANARWPQARATERRLLIERLDLRPGLTICDVGAGGGYLSDGIYEALGGACRIVCVENSAHFAESLADPYEKVVCSLSDLHLESASVDRVACLAGIHHQRDKARFFREAYRIARSGGSIAVGDVLAGSPPARFLNEAVDRHSDLGHDGMFLAAGELSALMHAAGFRELSETHHCYTWNFPDEPAMVRFCGSLFRMTKATPAQVAEELRRHLRIDVDRTGARLHWGLLFASGRKHDGAEAE